jgi:hypothetical protein
MAKFYQRNTAVRSLFLQDVMQCGLVVSLRMFKDNLSLPSLKAWLRCWEWLTGLSKRHDHVKRHRLQQWCCIPVEWLWRVMYLEDWTNRLYRNVGNYESKLHTIQEEWRSLTPHWKSESTNTAIPNFTTDVPTFTMTVKRLDLATLICSCYICNSYFCFVKGDNLSYIGVLIQLVT